MKQLPELLRIPGPTPIPPRIQRAMSEPMIGHRGDEAKQLLQTIRPKLQSIFGTKDDVLIVTGSGTAGLEAAAVNCASAGDDVLVIVAGAFGDRFANICETYLMNVHRLDVPWGEAVHPDAIKQMLQSHPQIKAVFGTFCETSTGVVHPVKEIGKVVQENSNALLIIDGVSAVAGIETKMDAWGVDIFVSGSQKAFMLPPGLTFIAVNERAWQMIQANEEPRFYLDLGKHRRSLDDDSTPFTPGLSLLVGLKEALLMLEEEGLANVFIRHDLMKMMTRAAMEALKIPLLTTDDDASATVTAIQPTDFSADDLRKTVNEEFGLMLAGGQQRLQGKILRIGHMGYCTPAHVLQVVSLLEIGLQRVGKSISLGQGVAAAQSTYQQEVSF